MRRYMRLPAMSVCLFVSKITQKRVHWFGWNVACRQMSGHGRTDYLLSLIRVIVRMPEPDCFLRYRMPCYAKFYRNVGKIRRRIRIGRCSEAWFYNGFIHWGSEPSKHLCRRYMRSTECPSSLLLLLTIAGILVLLQWKMYSKMSKHKAS